MRRNGHKFNAVRTKIDGYSFASKAEAHRYVELALLKRAGEIFELELQPKYLIVVETPRGDHVTVGSYRADFRYKRRVNGLATPETVVEDVKGVRTEAYQLKKKLVEAQYGITISEITT